MGDESGSQGEANASDGGSANIAAMRLRRMINEAQSFYSRAAGEPFDVYEMVGDDSRGRTSLHRGPAGALEHGPAGHCRAHLERAHEGGCRQAAADPPVFIVYEEGHNFAPAGEAAISKNIIKRIAAEGRKFGVGFAIVSQRPSKLDSDVTSQCNTIVAMRIKNPDDQRFIQKTSDYFSAADLAELPDPVDRRGADLWTGDHRAARGEGRHQGADTRRRVAARVRALGEVGRMSDRSTSLADTVFAALTDREVMVEHFPMFLVGDS